MEYPILVGKSLDLRVNRGSLLLLGAGNSGSACFSACANSFLSECVINMRNSCCNLCDRF